MEVQMRSSSLHSLWPAVAGILAAVIVAACREAIGPNGPLPPTGAYTPVVQFSTTCPPCDDTLSNAEWDNVQDAYEMVQVNPEGPPICESIYQQATGQAKSEWGKVFDWDQSGGHFPVAHGTGEPHFGIADDYVGGSWGWAAIAKVGGHEQAHHMGWPTNHSAWEGLPSGGLSVDENCFLW